MHRLPTPTTRADGVRNGIDSIFHDACMPIKTYSSHDAPIIVNIYSANAFNACSRSRMLATLGTKASHLAGFINSIYGLISTQNRFFTRDYRSSKSRGQPKH
eukprot:GFKZ01012638.1.p1 GENE.GFKZ01012638.1~~GFKZ01012638.1.p1  ORF type:complete len:102 (-),score=2.97 GFKZ01012638.1:15-320(-)